MVLSLWRSLHSLNLMLPKEDRKAMLLRLYNDESPLLDHSKERFKTMALEPSDDMSDADNEAAAVAEIAEKIQIQRASGDITLHPNDDKDEDVEEGGVAIDSLAGEGFATKAGEGSGAPRENYGSSMGADNPAE